MKGCSSEELRDPSLPDVCGSAQVCSLKQAAQEHHAPMKACSGTDVPGNHGRMKDDAPAWTDAVQASSGKAGKDYPDKTDAKAAAGLCVRRYWKK